MASRSTLLRDLTEHAIFGLIFFSAWEFYGRSSDLMPPISAVVVAFVDITLSGVLPTALLESIQLLLGGFALAAVLGFSTGVVMGRYQLVDRTFMPFVNALYATPTVALVPLVLIWFGFGMTGRLLVVFLASFFPILINVYAGVKESPKDLIEVARSFLVVRERDLLKQVIIPAAAPYIFSGMRLGLGLAVVGMAIAEVYLRLGGIGALIAAYGAVFRLDYLFAAIAPLPLLGIGLTRLVGWLEHRAEQWAPVRSRD